MNASAPPGLPQTVSASADSVAVKRPRGRPFVSGDPRSNTAGRIKKAPTVLDETIALAHKAKQRRRIAKAWVDTMAETGTAPGNRARADFSDRVYGLPKQTLVLERGEAPADALDAKIAQLYGGAPIYIEGESRVIDPAPTPDDITHGAPPSTT